MRGGATPLSLSVVIPVFNEAATIEELVRRVQAVQMTKQVIIVNDGSTDGTQAKLDELQAADNVDVFRQTPNQGKGAAVRLGISKARAGIVIIQDADLEYDPRDYHSLIQPILDGKADVVYGTRFAGGEAHRVLYFWHSIGNRFLTLLSNAFTNLNLTDMETGYKVFRRELAQQIRIEEDRFGFEPEVTAKLAKWPNIRIYEVGISYSGRTYQEGKKIKWHDGLYAIWCIVKYNMLRSS